MSGYTDRIFNNAQGAELIYQLSLMNQISAADATMSDLEKEIATEFASSKTGKVFATKEWLFATNTTSTCEKQMDSVGLNCVPSTDTVQGEDDFMKYLPFQWRHCNYVRDSDDGFARPTVLEGFPGYRTSGAVDVGMLAATFYWKVENHGTYRMWYLSDSPHPELGLVPWITAIKGNKVMPYYILSAYPSVTASDGLLRSQPGLAPAYGHSYNNCITNYQRKGNGYWGAGGDRTLHGYIMLMIKYATKNSQNIFAGCTLANHQILCQVAETDVYRVLLPSSASAQFYKDACVSVSASGQTAAPDRNNAVANATANRVRVNSVESVTVDGTAYYALNLDLEAAITTTTDMYVSFMPCFAGETDKVVGKYDGSYMSNTDMHHTYRIHGCEYNWGQWVVETDSVIEYLEDNTRRGLYVAPKGTAHVANAHTDYIFVGEMAEGSGDGWIGDVEVDYQTGAMYPKTNGSGSAVGTGDRFYRNAGTKGTLREKLTLGSLYHGSSSGLSSVSSNHALSSSHWYYGSCD